MKFSRQKIGGVYLIEPEPHEDKRGMLRRHFCQREFQDNKLMNNIRQTNVSENREKYTLRGFHYQLPPNGENKVVSCIKGSIYDIVVDLRKRSETYLQWESFDLTEENRLSIYVPIGCANAYLTLKDNTWILYYHSEFYTPEEENSIRYNDSLFKFKWPAEPKIISDKDLNILDWTHDK